MSTVAALLDPSGAGQAAEISSGGTVAPSWVPVVVARSTTHGAASACEMIMQWPEEIAHPWLVTVADAPIAPPATARFYLRAVRDRTAGIVRLPFLPQLRAAVSVAQVLNEPAVARAGQALRLHLSGPAQTSPVTPSPRVTTSRREDL